MIKRYNMEKDDGITCSPHSSLLCHSTLQICDKKSFLLPYKRRETKGETAKNTVQHHGSGHLSRKGGGRGRTCSFASWKPRRVPHIYRFLPPFPNSFPMHTLPQTPSSIDISMAEYHRQLPSPQPFRSGKHRPTIPLFRNLTNPLEKFVQSIVSTMRPVP